MGSSVISLSCLLVLIAAVGAVDRTLNVTINPGCPLTDCSTYGQDPPFMNNLLYVRSESVTNTTDSRQYRVIWSSIGAPSVIITEVSPAADKDLNLNWMNFLEDRKPEPPFLTLYGGRYAGLAFSRLIEYNDTGNTGQINDTQPTKVYEMTSARWFNVSLQTLEDGSLNATFLGSMTINETTKFNFTIEVRAHTADGRAAQNPRLLFTPASMTVRVILDSIPIHFSQSRFALEVIFASNDASMNVATHSQAKSISDEYSPGIFTVERVGGTDTYVQWRPVVYTKTNPGVSDSTRSQTGPLLPITDVAQRNTSFWEMPYSLLQGIAGVLDNGTTLVRFNVSFGITDDDFYNSTSYQEWSCDVGVGQAPVDAVSSNVRMIIAIGFGIPAVLVLLGGAYVAYLKIKKRKAARQSLLVTETTTTTNYQTLTS